MNDKDFWRLVALSRREFDPGRRDGNMDRQLELLRELLSTLPTPEVEEFKRRFEEAFLRAYRWDLWGAAYVIGSGCSDDWFCYFRYWLISMGEEVFQSALANPESLVVAAAEPGVEDIFFEEFSYVADEILESREDVSAASDAARPEEPAGERWKEVELPTRFPKLWAKYGRM